jgi:hypothetical protein
LCERAGEKRFPKGSTSQRDPKIKSTTQQVAGTLPLAGVKKHKNGGFHDGTILETAGNTNNIPATSFLTPTRNRPASGECQEGLKLRPGRIIIL